MPQHRLGGMGGSATKHELANVVWLCSLMNGLIESDAGMQDVAYRRGFKLRAGAVAEDEPIDHAVHGRVRLLNDGGLVAAPEAW